MRIEAAQNFRAIALTALFAWIWYDGGNWMPMALWALYVAATFGGVLLAIKYQIRLK